MPLESQCWGHPSRHYATSPGRAPSGTTTARFESSRRAQSGTQQKWLDLLNDVMPELRQTVERAVKQWNNIIRDHMRSETGFRLSIGGDSQSVPVRVTAGLPLPFANVLDHLSGLEWIIAHRPTIQAAATGANFLDKQYVEVLRHLPEEIAAASQNEIAHTHQTAKALLRRLEDAKAIEQIAGINEDVLGAYFFRTPEVQLYWMVIGIMALALGVSPAALTVVVLTHELAHAYTHLGRDIDEDRWDTEAFAATDMDVVEGLAQFYTKVICIRLRDRMPGGYAAYEALLKLQPEPYHAHTKWVGEDERGGEIVRVSMVECRSTKITSAQAFAAAVDRYRTQMKGRARRTGSMSSI